VGGIIKSPEGIKHVSEEVQCKEAVENLEHTEQRNLQIDLNLNLVFNKISQH
jgi:hypothetical protein